VEAPEFEIAIKRFIKMFDEMQSQLGQTPWLAGPAPTIADGAVFPYVLRLEHLGLETMLTPHPDVSDWLARMKQRPSFADAVGRWIPEEIIAFMKQKAPGEQEAIQQLLDEIRNIKKGAS